MKGESGTESRVVHPHMLKKIDSLARTAEPLAPWPPGKRKNEWCSKRRQSASHQNTVNTTCFYHTDTENTILYVIKSIYSFDNSYNVYNGRGIRLNFGGVPAEPLTVRFVYFFPRLLG